MGSIYEFTWDQKDFKVCEKESRVWVDGCYDMVHFGHANNFRQAKALGKTLIVGVHSDAEIQQHKGTPPVFKEEERYELTRAIKWVDQVVEAAPYVTTIETLDRYGCEYCAHGNDITTTADGTDTYQAVKDAGRYKEVDRTEGVSTTDLINRMIKASKIHRVVKDGNNNHLVQNNKLSTSQPKSSYTGNSKLILTTQKLLEFSNPPPTPHDKIVYVAGSFDVFNVGHLKFLKRAKELGSYVIVGLHDDSNANLCNGPGYPIMTLNERSLSLLACKYVSEVIIGAPLEVTTELLEHLNVSVVALGENGTRFHPRNPRLDLYKEAVRRNILQVVDSGSDQTTQTLVARVGQFVSEYEERNRKKEEKEAAIIAFQSLQNNNNN